MAVWKCCSPCGSCCFFFLLLLQNAAMAHATTATGGSLPFKKSCPSLDACRAGVANEGCCKAVNDAIVQGECSCVCKQLKIYNQGQLARECQGKWCARCGFCRCVNGVDGPYIY